MRTLQLVVGGLALTVWIVGRFVLRGPQRRTLDAAERRTQNRHAGISFILLGIVIVLTFGAAKIGAFSTATPTEMILVIAASMVCVGVGGWAIWTNRS